jgi:hypothetical protein
MCVLITVLPLLLRTVLIGKWERPREIKYRTSTITTTNDDLRNTSERAVTQIQDTVKLYPLDSQSFSFSDDKYIEDDLVE